MRWMNPKGEHKHRFLKENELIREDGRLERLCKHGVGHPFGVTGRKWEKWMGVHGCCGCCCLAEFYLQELT